MVIMVTIKMAAIINLKVMVELDFKEINFMRSIIIIAHLL